jgi:Major Facilitator Superfamily
MCPPSDTAESHLKSSLDREVGQARRRRSKIAQRCRDLSSKSRRAITEHRQRRRLRDREVSDQSRRGLDWTNFFMADVQMGFGAFLAFYLADQGWSKQDVGLALTIGGVAGVAAQIPGGALADAVRWKRGLAALGIVAIAVSALMLAWRPTLPIVFAAEVLHGIRRNRRDRNRRNQPRSCRPPWDVGSRRAKLPFRRHRKCTDRCGNGRSRNLSI